MLLSNDCIASIFATEVTVEHFSADGQDAIRVVRALYDRGSAIDALTLSEALADTGRYDVPDKKGDVRTAADRRAEAVNKAAAEITTWLESVTNTAYAVDHVKGVIRAARRRQQDELIAEAVRLRDAPTTSPDDLRSHFELMLEQDDRLSVSDAQSIPAFVKSGVRFDEFLNADVKSEYLINRVLSKGEEMIIGAPEKTLKTCIMADMAISLGSGTNFLDCEQFAVREPRRVCFMTIETGAAALQSLLGRIARSKQIHPEDIRQMVTINQELPIIANDWHMQELKKYINGEGFDAMLIDPAYLTLFDEGSKVQAGNLFEMGPLLRRITHVRKETGATFTMAHHTRKAQNRTDYWTYRKTTRDDLSQAGFSQWMRQWILPSRKAAYSHDGKHTIHLEMGGSSGHGGEYVLQVDEGKRDNGENQILTDWQTIVTPAREFDDAAKAAQEKNGESRKDETLERNVQKILKAMQVHAAGSSLAKTNVAGAAKVSNSIATTALFELLSRGQVERDGTKWKLVSTESDKPDNTNGQLSCPVPDQTENRTGQQPPL